MKKMAHQYVVVMASVLSSALLFGMISNLFGYHYMQLVPAAVAQEKENTANTPSPSKNMTNAQR
jgi:hypothetical protein